MAGGYVSSVESNDDVAGSTMQRLSRRCALSISIPVLLAGTLSACGKRGALEAPRPASDTVRGEGEEGAQ